MAMKELGIFSQAVHGGVGVFSSNSPEAMPIYQTSVFTFQVLDHLEACFKALYLHPLVWQRLPQHC